MNEDRLQVLFANAIDLLRTDTNDEKEHAGWKEYICRELITTEIELKNLGIEL